MASYDFMSCHNLMIWKNLESNYVQQNHKHAKYSESSNIQIHKHINYPLRVSNQHKTP